MPYLGELDDVRPLLTPGTSVLELGAGAGRLTRKLLEWGLNVTAVDNSADMLVYVPGDANRVFRASLLLEAEIETLLADVGFHSCEWLGEKRRWVRAVVYVR